MIVFLVVKSKSEADKKQSNLLKITLNFNDKVRPRSIADKEMKSSTYENGNIQLIMFLKVG